MAYTSYVKTNKSIKLKNYHLVNIEFDILSNI